MMPTKSWMLTLLTIAAAGCAEGAPRTESASRQNIAATAPSVTSAKKTSALERVEDRSQVCMVNNHFMGAPQIPVVVEGRTYYGCCPMCKAKLEQEPAARTAIDPVTKKPVDKAVAIIGKTKTGAALYFENEQNLLAYSHL